MRLTTPSWKKTHVTETYTRVYIGGDSNEAHQATGLMTDDSQTREGAGAPTVDLLKPKQKMRVLERPDLVPDWQDAPAGQRVWQLQSGHLGGQRGQMDRHGEEETGVRTYHCLLGKIRWPALWRSSPTPQQKDWKSIARVETIWIKTFKSKIPLQVHQAVSASLLRSNWRCKCRSQGCILRSAPNSRGERPRSWHAAHSWRFECQGGKWQHREGTCYGQVWNWDHQWQRRATGRLLWTTCWLEAPFSSINTFIKQHGRRQTGPQKTK